MLSLVGFVTVLSILFYFYASFGVARARRVSGIEAPVMSGHDQLDRAVRVHVNTLEWMPIYLPLLWLNVVFPSLGYQTPAVAAVVGLVWIVGRWLYMTGYMADPSKRGPGFMIQGLACVVLLIGAVAGCVLRLMAGG